ncbi:centromeric protein-C [Cochliomyia hominivorax]
MPRASTSLELSEFFNNDDSDGQRLAEFLQKKRGGVQRQNFLFMNCEPQRLSLNVQLEKITPSKEQKQQLQQENGKENNEQQTENNNSESVNRVVNEENCADVCIEKEMSLLHGDIEEPELPTCSKYVYNFEAPKVPSILCAESPISPARPQSPLAVDRHSHKRLSPPRPQSPRLTAMRRNSGAISPGDRLRRYSLKRLSKIGKRALMQEFESLASDSNFEPPLCSTPLSQPQPNKPHTSPTTSNSPESQNSNTSSTEKSPARSDSCCGHTDTLIRTLQRKDEELKNYMESILENTLKQIHSQEKENQKNIADTMNSNGTLQATKSPLKRTYTVEKGNTPGQVILTPDKSISKEKPCQAKLLKSISEGPSVTKLKTPERKLTRSMSSISIKIPNNRNNTFQKENQSILSNSHISNKDAEILEKHQEQIYIPNTPPPKSPHQHNISIVFPNQEVEIPETQDLPIAKENSIIQIQSSARDIPVVVIPVNPNFNKSYGEAITNNNTIITARTKHSINNTKALETIKNNEGQFDEENLKLTDILTDDEEETPKAAAENEYNSQSPLNLAPSATNRTKRLRKRSILRRKLQMDNSQLVSTETETEPPPAHCSRRMIKKKRIPLNRAPGTPLNGERFAQELARMSNYEILDLRKRNSMGRIFALSGRKSTRAQEEAIKKQHQLENQIEMELHRRNIDDTEQETRIRENKEVSQEVEIERPELLEAFLPVPDEFCDSLAKRNLRESPLIDEKSSDRVSFKKRRDSTKHQMSRRSSKPKEKPMPEILKQYLEGQFESEEQKSPKQNSSTNETLSTSRINRKSIPYVPSPPKSDGEQITIPKVVSPPPPLNITTRKSLKSAETAEVNNIEVLPPPPSGFESDSGVSSNNFNIHSSTNTKHTDETHNSDTQQINYISNATNHDEENIFKKPLHPAPKKGRPKKSKIPSNEILQSDLQQTTDDNSSGTDTTDSSLRRSKRGQVPAKTTIFQQLYQEHFNKRLQKIEKNMKKSRKYSNSKKKLNDNTTLQSVGGKNTGITKKRTRLPTLPEDDEYVAEVHKDNRIMNKKSPKNKETKVNRKDNKNNNNNNKQEPVKEPPPIDHLNNVFDQLRNTSDTQTQISASPSPLSPALPSSETTTSTKINRKKNKNKKQKEQFECSHITMATPPPVDHLNNVFDQLRNTSDTQTQISVSPPPLGPALPSSQTTTTSTKVNAKEKKSKKQKQVKEKFECSHIKMATPPPVDHLNNVFDQLRNTSYTQARISATPPTLPSSKTTTTSTALQKVKPFKIRVARLKTNSTLQTNNTAQTNSRLDTVGVCSTTNNSNNELISWLKNITEANYDTGPEEIFKEMRISPAANLSFTELQGIEYAFYDTDEKASLGYLRFKPGQIKRKKRAKRYHLHFVTLVGSFRIRANDKESQLSVGDMVAIEKFVYYDIENISDDIGILMVVKK